MKNNQKSTLKNNSQFSAVNFIIYKSKSVINIQMNYNENCWLLEHLSEMQAVIFSFTMCEPIYSSAVFIYYYLFHLIVSIAFENE